MYEIECTRPNIFPNAFNAHTKNIVCTFFMNYLYMMWCVYSLFTYMITFSIWRWINKYYIHIWCHHTPPFLNAFKLRDIRVHFCVTHIDFDFSQSKFNIWCQIFSTFLNWRKSEISIDSGDSYETMLKQCLVWTKKKYKIWN